MVSVFIGLLALLLLVGGFYLYRKWKRAASKHPRSKAPPARTAPTDDDSKSDDSKSSAPAGGDSGASKSDAPTRDRSDSWDAVEPGNDYSLYVTPKTKFRPPVSNTSD